MRRVGWLLMYAVIGIAWAYWYGKKRGYERHVCTGPPPLPTVDRLPWPHEEHDRPPVNYITVPCADCGTAVNCSTMIRLRHVDGQPVAVVSVDTTDMAAHEMTHRWGA